MVALRQLKQLGCHAEAVANGQEAIREVTQIGYDVVLMDCQMPEMDGYKATARLRELGFNMPIIALTADAMKGARERCLEAGMTDYLCKPLRLPELGAMLERIAPADEKRAHAMPDEEVPVISAETLALFRDAASDDASFASELLNVFCRETADLITEIYQAISTGDTAQLGRATHKMKGSCAAFGAEALVRVCVHLEEQIETGGGPGLVAYARQLRTERQRLLDALESGATATAGV
jgi:CheY-like chemotaxis protein